MRLFALSLLTALIMAPATQAHEASAQGLHIAHPFATPTPPGAPNGAAYLTISAEGDSISLVGAASPVSEAVEIHSMSMDDGTMRMRRLDRLEVPAGETVKLRPGGGAHFMLIGLREALKIGDTFPMTLEFANHDSVEIEVRVHRAGENDSDSHRH